MPSRLAFENVWRASALDRDDAAIDALAKLAHAVDAADMVCLGSASEPGTLDSRSSRTKQSAYTHFVLRAYTPTQLG